MAADFLRSGHDQAAHARQVLDLLLADAQSPAMLFYLDNFQSVSPNAQPPQQRPGAARGPLANLRMSNNPQQQRPQQQQQRRGINEELRARIDGAAHARRRWRLHPEGRAGSCALLYGMDDHRAARCRCRGPGDD